MRIVDLSNPADPNLVGRIPLRDLGTHNDHSLGDAVATHIASGAFEGDVAIVLYGVPDQFAPESYPQPYGIWDVTDPSNPTFLSVLDLGNATHGNEGGDLGGKPYDAKAVAGNYFYALYDGQSRTTPRDLFNEDTRLGVCAAEAQAAGQDGSGVCGDVADWGHDGLGRGVADESGWLGGRREGRAGVPRSFHRRDGVGHGALRRPGGCAAA